MPSDARAAAIAALHCAIDALAPSLHDSRDLDDLLQLRHLAARLARPSPPGLRAFDPAQFHHLLALAGPDLAGELLSNLIEDLARCRSQALAGAFNQDWAALRASSHVLISLAGSVGAPSLQAMAEALHSTATLAEGPAANAVDPALLAELDALIALVRATPAPSKASA